MAIQISSKVMTMQSLAHQAWLEVLHGSEQEA